MAFVAEEREIVGCLTDETLAALAAGALSGPAMERVQSHVASCPACGQLLAHGLESGPAREPSRGASVSGEFEKGGRPLCAGDAVGRYVIEERIGSGAMGVVYAARDPQLNRTVAVKVLRAVGDGSGALTSAARLLREARAMACLVHPNVVAVYDAGEVDDRVFVAMQRVSGGTLTAWLAQGGHTWREALAVCIRAGRGLDAAHRAGLVHRDFKPDNVLVSGDGQVQVTDFGLARAERLPGDTTGRPAPDAPGTDAAVHTLATADGTLLGTPAYMSPEQMRCEPATVRSDVFGFCATAYEALYGQRPFEGGSLPALLDSVVRGSPRPTPAGNAVPSSVRRVLLRGLHAEPQKRHASVDAVLVDLSRAARRPWGRLAAMVAVPLLVVAAAAALAHPGWVRRGAIQTARSRGRPRPSVAIIGLLPEVSSPAEAWLEPVLGELVASELGAGERLRVIPSETVSRLRRDFRIPAAGQPDPDAVARLASAAGADVVLVGTYRISGGRVRVSASLREVGHPQAAADVTAEGPAESLPDLVAQIDVRVREAVGTDAASDVELAAAHAALPAPGEALRLYATGVDALGRGELSAAREALSRTVALDGRSPRAHGALATALMRIGMSEAAAAEARLAVARSAGLGRADQLWLEGLAFEAEQRWDPAIDTYKALLRFYPDEIEYGFRLVTAQTRGEKWADAYASITSLRQRPAPEGGDPRIDWLEARVADAAGDYAHDQRSAEEAARNAAALGERLVLADARAEQAFALVQLGDRVRARVANDQAQRLYDELGDRAGRAMTLRISAMMFEAELDYDAAIEKAQEALSIVRSQGDAPRILIYLMGVAGLHGLVGELGKSIAEYEEVAALARERAQHGSEATAQSNLGWFRTLAGRFVEARMALAEAARLEDELGSHRGYYQLGFRAYLEMLSGDLSAARSAAEASARLAHEAGNPGAEADALRFLALAMHEQGDRDAASRALDQAAALLPVDSSQLSDLEATRATVALDEGRGHEAAELAARAEDRYRRGHAVDEAGKAAALACRGLVQIKDVTGAQASCRRADERAQSSEALDVAVRAAMAHAELVSEQGNASEAQVALDAALARASTAGAAGLALEVRAAAVRIAARRGAVSRAAMAARLADEASRHGFLRLARKASSP